MRSRLLTIILYFFLSLLLFAGIQGIFHPVKEKKLWGEVSVSDSCIPSLGFFMDGRFQQCATLWINTHLGFRSTLIRINNQIAVSLFSISPAKNVVIGKDHYLFQPEYINSFLGNDYTDRAQITGKVGRLLWFQKILKEQNKHFILVFCPSKARFMPENLPEKYRKKGFHTNYDTYVDVISREGKGLNFIDFNSYFLGLKDTSTFTLYPKAGIHWSNFSSRQYALDSLLGYMEHLSGKKHPRIITERIYQSDSLQIPDDDLAEMLNLLIPYPSGKVTYADFVIDTSGAVKPDVLAIADSYYWEIFGFDKIGSIFNVSDFWVWNEVRYPKSKYDGIRSDDIMFLKQDLLEHDFIILMVTETNLSTLLDFDENTFALFDPENPVIRELQKKRADRIVFFKKLILGDPKWTALIKQKAKDRKVTFEKMLQTDAEYMVEYEINNLRNK
jgi:hypothetical protein